MKNKLPNTPKELIKSLPKDLKNLLFKQWSAKQNPEWHPEGNTLKHIIVVLKRAYHHYPDDPNMIMAALFHDLGKVDTYQINPKTGQPTAYGHENKSTDYVEQHRSWIESFDGTDVDEIKYLVQNHMKVKPSTWNSMKDTKKEPIKTNKSFDKLMGFTDKLDGGGTEIEKKKLQESIRRILREETNAKLYILRRYSFEELESIFNQKLQNQSINFKHYENKSLDFFSNSIVKTMTETILEELTNGWVEESPVSEESLHDFIKKLFEDKIIKKYEELQDIHIEIYDVKYGFNVLIMMGDEKIGEIVFEEGDDDINYTIVDAKIDPQYRKKGLYQKAIIKVFEEKPNIIINSVFRSPEAERSWELLVSKLPDNIEYKTKYYREEQTRLHQLRLKNN